MLPFFGIAYYSRLEAKLQHANYVSIRLAIHGRHKVPSQGHY